MQSNPTRWKLKTNKGFNEVKINSMDNKHIHTAIKLIKTSTNLDTDKFGEFTRKEWLDAFRSELNRREKIGINFFKMLDEILVKNKSQSNVKNIIPKEFLMSDLELKKEEKQLNFKQTNYVQRKNK
jgi:hypothetical protein